MKKQVIDSYYTAAISNIDPKIHKCMGRKIPCISLNDSHFYYVKHQKYF